MEHRIHSVLCFLLPSTFVDVRSLLAGRGAGGRLDSLASRRFCGKGTRGRACRRHPVRSRTTRKRPVGHLIFVSAFEVDSHKGTFEGHRASPLRRWLQPARPDQLRRLTPPCDTLRRESVRGVVLGLTSGFPARAWHLLQTCAMVTQVI